MTVFDIYFASVVSMQYHPRQLEKGKTLMSIEQCATVALKMLEVRKTLVKEGKIWPGSEQQ